MGKERINDRLARNLRFFMGRCDYKNPTALAKVAGVSPEFVRYLLKPNVRTVASDKAEGEGYPRIDKLEKIAAKLGKGVEVWMLLHPDIERALKEQEFYKRLREDYDALQAKSPDRLKETEAVSPPS